MAEHSERGRGEEDRSFPPSEPPSARFDGEDFLFHLYRGSELLQDNCINEAKEELERALSLQPRDIEGQALLGIVYFRLGMYPRAIQIYEDIVSARPREATPRLNLALCYLKTGQAPLAREMLEEVIRMVPDHKRAWGYLGLAFERLSDYAKAHAAFERAGQANMARRMQLLLEDAAARDAPEAVDRAGLRDAAAEAVRELETEVTPFSHAESEQDAPSRSGRWAAIEPGAVASVDISAVAPRHEAPESPPRPLLAPARALDELAASATLRFGDSPSVCSDARGWVLVRFTEGFAVRTAALRVFRSEGEKLTSKPLLRRSRGRELAEPVGSPAAPFLWFEGAGRLILAGEDDIGLALIELAENFIYVCENRLLGFGARLQHENGRLASGGGESVPIAQLSGSGTVIIESKRPIASLEVRAGEPLIARVDDVVAWSGRLFGAPLSSDAAPDGAHGFVEFTGEGTLYLT